MKMDYPAGDTVSSASSPSRRACTIMPINLTQRSSNAPRFD